MKKKIVILLSLFSMISLKTFGMQIWTTTLSEEGFGNLKKISTDNEEMREAIRNGKVEEVKRLVEEKTVDINGAIYIETVEGEKSPIEELTTPLCLAVRENQVEIVEELIENGADPLGSCYHWNIENTPFGHAVEVKGTVSQDFHKKRGKIVFLLNKRLILACFEKGMVNLQEKLQMLPEPIQVSLTLVLVRVLKDLAETRLCSNDELSQMFSNGLNSLNLKQSRKAEIEEKVKEIISSLLDQASVSTIKK